MALNGAEEGGAELGGAILGNTDIAGAGIAGFGHGVLGGTPLGATGLETVGASHGTGLGGLSSSTVEKISDSHGAESDEALNSLANNLDNSAGIDYGVFHGQAVIGHGHGHGHGHGLGHGYGGHGYGGHGYASHGYVNGYGGHGYGGDYGSLMVFDFILTFGTFICFCSSKDLYFLSFSAIFLVYKFSEYLLYLPV